MGPMQKLDLNSTIVSIVDMLVKKRLAVKYEGQYIEDLYRNPRAQISPERATETCVIH
jgi:hypothetical protein